MHPGPGRVRPPQHVPPHRPRTWGVPHAAPMTRTQARPEHPRCPQHCPKGRPHSWRPEHQKFIELSTFPKAQLATHTGGLSPGPDFEGHAGVTGARTPQGNRQGPGRGRGAEGGEWGSPRAEASGWKFRPPGCREEVCRADKAPGATRREQCTPQGGEDQPLTRSFCSRLWGARTRTHDVPLLEKGAEPQRHPPNPTQNWEGGGQAGKGTKSPSVSAGASFWFFFPKGKF